MSKYGQAAIQAVKYLQEGNAISPKEAWVNSTSEIFGEGSSGQIKSCPQDAFLSLCETGCVQGVKPGSYTKSVKNKEYSLKALDLIRENPEYAHNPDKLWKVVQGHSDKKHNSQMNVVAALWLSGSIKE